MKQKNPKPLSPLAITITKNIVTTYNECGLDEVQAREKIGMKQATFNNYCRGRIPKVEKLIEFCKAFHVSLDKIVGLEEEQATKKSSLLKIATRLLIAYENPDKKDIVASGLRAIFGSGSEEIIKLLDDLLESKHSPPRKLLVTEVAKKHSKQAA